MEATRHNARHKRRFLRLTLITALVLGLVAFGLHLWFVANARNVLKEIVKVKSHGKLKLELDHLSFNFFSNKIVIRDADLVSTDSTTQALTYHVKFRKLTLRVASLWPLLTQKKLFLDSIKLHDPEIEVVQWQKDTSSTSQKDDFSVPHEMGKLYNSMLDALDAFSIKRIAIDNAKLSLVNKMKRGSEPVTISKIYFDLVRTANNAKKKR